MIIGLAYLLVLASVPLARGRISALADLPLRKPALALVAIALQILVISVIPGGDQTIHTTLHLASYFLLGAFAFANRRIVGVPIIALGGLSNFIAIAANGGVMPTHPDAVESVASTAAEGEFINSRVIEDARLQFLGDIFATPTSLPLHNVFSIGDVFLLIGVFVLVHAACGSRVVPRRWSARPAVS
jgi:Family of unknown function (DUF5317)